MKYDQKKMELSGPPITPSDPGTPALSTPSHTMVQRHSVLLFSLPTDCGTNAYSGGLDFTSIQYLPSFFSLLSCSPCLGQPPFHFFILPLTVGHLSPSFLSSLAQPPSFPSVPSVSSIACQGTCFGCASAATEHCITLLQALAYRPEARCFLAQESLIRELVDFNLRAGNPQMQGDIRKLLCHLTRWVGVCAHAHMLSYVWVWVWV